MPVDPWPNLDYDPIILVLDNTRECYDGLMSLVRTEPDNVRATRRLYEFVTRDCPVILLSGNRRDQYDTLKAGFRTLHNLSGADELTYWVQLYTYYYQTAKERTK